MKTIFKAFSKNLFGAKYERLTRTIFIYPILFWGLYTADFKVQISPFILYLMVPSFTAGVMWQTLSSEDNAANMQNMIMLPFEGREFIFSYIGAIGIYTFLTKTMALLVILLAVSVWNRIEILSSILCAVNAILMAAAIFSVRRYWYVGTLWLTVIFVSIFFGWEKLWFIPMLSANSTLAFLLLQSTNGYTFYFQKSKDSSTVRGRKHLFVWTYFFRYLKDHKNYLMNIAIMWCIACILLSRLALLFFL